MTLAFWRLGKVKGWDAFFYIIAQFLGGIAGVFERSVFCASHLVTSGRKLRRDLARAVWRRDRIRSRARDRISAYETVLHVSNTPHLWRYTGVFAGCLVATYITFEAPISGMSMNPARTFGSAYVGHLWTALWIYFTAPVVAMQLAGDAFPPAAARSLLREVHHHNSARCIFNCRFPELAQRELEPG